ncbi:MAG: hypothetical protein KatS3mg009_2327 [Acidimicrobiia bacterium]|nr:MAG: hypothetical protein KatS3mg009_2327 [Acidimicrobiia bacterium]
MTTTARADRATAHRTLLAATVAVAAVVAALGSVHPMFLADDWGHVGEAAWSRRGGLYLRPVVDLSFWLDRSVHGLGSARGFHVTNLALHALNGVLVYLLALRLGRVGDERDRTLPFLAAAGAGFWVVLSGHANAVSWVVGRGDLLATAFVLGSFWWYLRHRERGDPRSLAAALGCYQVAVFAKETVLAWPLALVAFEACLLLLAPGPAPPARRVRALCTPLLFVGPVVVNLAVRTVLDIRSSGDLTGFDPTRLAPRAFQHLMRSLLPAEAFEATAPLWRSDLVQLAVLAAVAGGLAWGHLRREPGDPLPARTIALGAMFVAVIAPASQKAESLLTSDLATRLNHLPSALVVLAAVLVLVQVWSRAPRLRFVAAAVAVALAAANLVALQHRNREWRAAGDVTASILDDVERRAGTGEGPLLVVALPDRVGDAYVFRNGFRDALRVRGVERTFAVAVADSSVVPSTGARDPIGVARDGDALVFTAAAGGWYRLADHPGLFETEALGPASFRLSADPAARVVVWSQGRLRPVDELLGAAGGG